MHHHYHRHTLSALVLGCFGLLTAAGVVLIVLVGALLSSQMMFGAFAPGFAFLIALMLLSVVIGLATPAERYI